MEELITYGGDPRIIATRSEIERVQSGLAAAGNLLGSEVEVTDFLLLPLKRIGLAMELPPMQERIRHLLSALQASASEYFDGEALVAKELSDLGLFSAPAIAAGFLGLTGQSGRGAPVEARQTDSFIRASPKTLADLAKRIERSGQSGQVSIERYGQTYVAYIPGTQNWSPIAAQNPLDFTSNLQAMSKPGLAASEIAVQQALAKSGAGKSSKIVLIGHSQGGLIAANIAVQDKRVAALVTFGAPIGQVASQLKVPVVAIEHSNDIVPKLGLKANPLVENMVTVVREMPIEHESKTVVEAHDISNYTKTAEIADKSQEFGLKRVRAQVLELFGQEPAEVSVYKINRN